MSTSTPPSVEFSEALTNVRRQTTSKLTHNSKPAQLLNAIEQTLTTSLKIDTLPHSPTAYFISSLQCLEKAVNDDTGGEEVAETENMGQGALIPATLYLLGIVVPETPANVVISKLSSLLESILPLFENAMEHPPALRSLIQIITSLILFASPAVLNSSPLLKKSWAYLLELNLDPRPKVRHLAQEGVRKVLTTPVPPKVVAGGHPYLPKAREWVEGVMEEESKGGTSAGKKKARFAEGEDSEGKRAIWVVQGLRGWAAVWGESHMSNLCSLLLSLPPIPHLTPQIYSLLANLFTPPPADSTTAAPAVLTNLPTVIDSLIASPPNINSNTVDIPSYLQALTSALIKMSLQDSISLSAYIPRAFNLIYHDMLLAPSPSPAVMVAASDAIGSQGILRYCLSDEMIVASVNYKRQGSDQPGARKKQKTPFLSKLIAALTESLDKHALRIQYLLPILAAAISRLRVRVTDGAGDATIDPTGRGMTAAEVLLMDLIKDIADLKNDTGFEHKAKVDEVVGMAIEVIGVEGILKTLPLNIEPDANGNTPRPGRAYLLPLIRCRTTNDSLLFFATYFRPLSERVFAKKVAADEGNRGTEAKIWEAIVGQIWDCFPGFCEMPRDMTLALDTPFLSLLTNLLYNQQSLLPSLLRALSQLVNSTSRLMNSTTDAVELRKQFGMDQEDAKGNMDHLKSKAKDMVAVLLNVFAQLPRESRGMVGEVIGIWTGIMTDSDIQETYKGVTSHLSTALESTAPIAPGSSPLSHTMLDLLIVFVPYLPPTQSTSLFNAIATPAMLEHSDATVQKKSYRLLKRLLENKKLNVEGKELEVFVEKLNAVGGGVGPGAQRDRLQLLSALVESLPTDHLALIPEILSEAVLGTKEVNEKARDAGFDLLVVMGNKMAKGGSVTRLVASDEMEEGTGQEETVQANAEEYITMVAAGLTAATPHMISASINALSRLLFEFKDSISTSTISELVATITVFLQSKNREIVKSALGFIKVAIVALPHDAITPHLQALVPALLGWVHDHKNHFKQKTVHIFERMIRKFGYDDIYRFAGEGDEKKVLVGIRRKKERAKKKKAAGGEGEGDEEGTKKTSSGNAFDDILYNSDSDAPSSDEEEAPGPNAQRGRGPQPTQSSQFQSRKGAPVQKEKKDKKDKERKDTTAYIRNEGDEPMDLLSRSIAGNVATTDPSQASRKRKPGQDASHFKTDKSGKLIIDEPSTTSNTTTETSGDRGDAYLANQMAVGGAVRDAKGTLKFNKNTKRGREVEKEYEDTYSGGVLEKEEIIKKKKKEVTKLGEEFRSKRGKGDIKKNNGPDPYSYVPIDQAARGKKGQQSRMSMTNKKKGSKA